MNQYPSLRLTPSNSPYFRSATPRSPSKVNKVEEPRLRLRKVIGTTTNGANGFDCLPSVRKFAYTAGAAAVVATVDNDLNVTQQFFRARPNTSASSKDNVPPNPSTPTPNESRSRALISLKDSVNGVSPWTASGRDWVESPIGKSLTAKDRIKAATSVALSPNGKWLAVGESGYKPRVLIFRVSDENTEEPVSSVGEHTFGIHALGFSPDSKYLASLGAVNDGFLYVWSIDERTGAATLAATNKCTSVINRLAWMGRAIVTAGLRFAKVWRPDEERNLPAATVESNAAMTTPRPRLETRLSEYGKSILTPKHKVLPGKNSLLGDLLEANFINVLPFQEDKAYLCADSGEICLLDDTERMQALSVVAHAGFRVTAARLDTSGNLHVAGAIGQYRTFQSRDLVAMPAASTAKSDRRKSVMPISRTVTTDGVMVISTAHADNVVVELDSLGGLRLYESAADSVEPTVTRTYQVPAHEAAVLGVQRMKCHELPNAAFFTFSGNGTVQIWNAQGASVTTLTIPIDSTPDMYGWTNELRAAAILNDAAVIATGDRHGNLSILNIRTRAILAQARAHASEVADVVAFEKRGINLIATGGRDRTVQLFIWVDKELRLLQTLDEHAGAINGLMFTPDGEHLLSCSADRTVVVREAMLRDEDELPHTVFAMLRTITLKSTPTSLCQGAQDDAILVSTTDRCITNFNLKTGQTGFGFKCSDSDGGEAAVMSKILLARFLNSDPTIIGVSSSDKSVRIYSEVGSLLARDWGHTEGITGVAMISSPGELEQATVVTVAADSTVFLWDTSPANFASRRPSSDSNAVEASRTVRAPMPPPLRKVLSHSELSRYRRKKALEEDDSASPTEVPVPPISPHRSLRKKSSKMGITLPPRLEPSMRRKSLRQRSPSPPSPPSRGATRRPSLGIPLRSRTSEGALSASVSSNSTGYGFGTLASSTESVCRTLRSYRKRLANSPADDVSPDILRDMERELKLTARVLSQKSQGRGVVDEAMMARLLDQTSERIVNMLDERLKGRDKIVELKDDVDKLTADMDAIGLSA